MIRRLLLLHFSAPERVVKLPATSRFSVARGSRDVHRGGGGGGGPLRMRACDTLVPHQKRMCEHPSLVGICINTTCLVEALAAFGAAIIKY